MTGEVVPITGELTVQRAESSAEKTEAFDQGVVATIKVVDGAGEVLGAVAVAADVLPVRWTVTIDPILAEDRSGNRKDLFVWAALRSGRDAWWGTLDLVRADGAQIVLSRVPD